MEVALRRDVRWHEVALHGLIWFLYAFLSYRINKIFMDDLRLGDSLLVTMIVIIFFYWLVWILNLTRKRKTRVYGVVLMIGSVFSLYYISYFFIYEVFPTVGVSIFEEELDFNQNEFLQNYYKALFTVSVYAFLYFVILRNRSLGKRREQDLIEKARLQDKINRNRAQFLTAQIYPHFVKNTFQGLVGEALLRGDHKAAASITSLSELMDYTTEQASGEYATVYVKKELQHLEKLLRLIQLRHRGDEVVDYSKSGFFSGEKIPPITLLTFLENVLKYGVVSAAHPLRIRADCTEKYFHFTCKNRKKTSLSKPIASTRIGLDNIRQRLALHLPNKYDLTIVDEEQYFEVSLKIENDYED